jgi:hypothetical protein
MGSLYDIKFSKVHSLVLILFFSLLNLGFSKFPSWSAAQVVSWSWPQECQESLTEIRRISSTFHSSDSFATSWRHTLYIELRFSLENTYLLFQCPVKTEKR